MEDDDKKGQAEVALASYLPPIVPEIPEPIYLDETADLAQTVKADMEFLNTQFKIVHSLWSHIRTVKSAHEQIRLGMELIEKRRHIRGQVYGSPTNKVTSSTGFEPVE